MTCDCGAAPTENTGARILYFYAVQDKFPFKSNAVTKCINLNLTGDSRIFNVFFRIK